MIEPRTNPVHLYRALLRECTYLPDPRARTYFHNHVISSFRQYLPRTKSWRAEIPFERQVRLLNRGRKELSMLRRANEGYLKPLEKVLMTTYGRVGKRRRQLMSKLMYKESPEFYTERRSTTRVPEYAEGWEPPELIKTLIRSQAVRHGHLDRIGGRVTSKPNIPKETIWRKQLPASRARNLVKKWYVRNVDLILPPLPETEWLELRQKAQGKAPWSGPPKRRSEAVPLDEPEAIIAKPEALLEGPERDPSFARYVAGRPHQITLRLMRHMWAIVLRHTPVLVMDPVKEQLEVRWDEIPKRSQTIARPGYGEASLLFGNWPVNSSNAGVQKDKATDLE